MCLLLLACVVFKFSIWYILDYYIIICFCNLLTVKPLHMGLIGSHHVGWIGSVFFFIRDKKKDKVSPGMQSKGKNNPLRRWHCIYCGEKFMHPPTEDWIQCNICEEWCHENCADRGGKKGQYACDLCAK